MMFRRALIAALLVVGAAPFTGALAVASCAPSNPAEQAARAEVIAVGTVVETRQTFIAAGGVIRFRPERVLKGTLTSVVQVYLGPSRGGNGVTSVDYTAVARGEQHTLYLRAVSDGSYETDSCSGSHPGGPTAEEERAFGAGVLVAVANDETTSPIVIGAVVLLVALAAGLVLYRARQTRP
ncbi:MAG: hypothetical protein M3R54_06860 [Chloroflexota bacterium]|nr:hypothetical protein [Chloroflexota bacterium]